MLLKKNVSPVHFLDQAAVANGKRVPTTAVSEAEVVCLVSGNCTDRCWYVNGLMHLFPFVKR